MYKDLDDSICCPACSQVSLVYIAHYFIFVLLLDSVFQEGSTEVVSMDANFGLCRKKTSGTSERLPLSEQRFFVDQAQVDAFVHSYKSASSKSSSVRMLIVL